MDFYTIFDKKGFEEYCDWLKINKDKYRSINQLIISIQRNGPLNGLGKPELLKGNYKGCYSRRIDEKNRLIYRYAKDKDGNPQTVILGCRDHYSGKENTYKQNLFGEFNI